MFGLTARILKSKQTNGNNNSKNSSLFVSQEFEIERRRKVKH